MRHKLGYRKLNRTSEHRKALFKNMLNSLIKYDQIKTTLPKAKELRPQIDKIITLGKKKNLQSRKNLISKLESKGYTYDSEKEWWARTWTTNTGTPIQESCLEVYQKKDD